MQAERDSLQQQLDSKKAAQEQAARQQEQQELENQSYETVYWTPNGECYHSTPNCPNNYCNFFYIQLFTIYSIYIFRCV